MNNKSVKMLIVNRSLNPGGIETSFLNFIKAMEEDVDIEAYICNYEGELKDRLPEDIKVYEGNGLVKFSGSVKGFGSATTSKPSSKFRKFAKFIYNKLGIRKFLSFIALFTTKKLKKQYDLSLCYCGQDEVCCELALKKVKANKKWVYVHEDVSKYPINKCALKQYEKFDKILCVSKASAEVFKTAYPQFANKVDYLYNFQNVEKIKELSTQFEVDYPTTFNLVSVSRIVDAVKGYTRSLKVLKKLHEEGYDFVWHIIGDGIDKRNVENYITENDMSEYVKLYGSKSNPYPYIKSADLLYLGSYFESWGLVLIEAMILSVPVLTTKVCSVDEIIEDKECVCENNEDDIYNKLKQVIDNKNKITSIKHKTSSYNFDNEKIKDKFFDMVYNQK